VTGRFVVLEGGDGSGKSTQMPRLAEWLRDRFDVDVVMTREPGGTPLGRTLRALVLEGQESIDPNTEALLMAADRAQHVAEVIRPAVARGAWVLSDRHVPSSLVYQGVVRGIGVDAIAEVNAWATSGLAPGLVIVLDVSEEVAATRRPGAPDRLEREGDAFHARVRAAYRDLAAARDWCLVDGSGSPDAVAARVAAAVTERLAP
jgi:dTMP kinase